jgi:hypothetical protein
VLKIVEEVFIWGEHVLDVVADDIEKCTQRSQTQMRLLRYRLAVFHPKSRSYAVEVVG